MSSSEPVIKLRDGRGNFIVTVDGKDTALVVVFRNDLGLRWVLLHGAELVARAASREKILSENRAYILIATDTAPVAEAEAPAVSPTEPAPPAPAPSADEPLPETQPEAPAAGGHASDPGAAG